MNRKKRSIKKKNMAVTEGWNMSRSENEVKLINYQ